MECPLAALRCGVDLAWNWLCMPYLACALSLAAVGLAAALVRGDRVLRLGAIGAATAALPWATCSAIVACTSDPELAARLLRVGNGPIALVGPSILLVLLGVSGQLERHRWIAHVAGWSGVLLTAICWATPWVVAGARPLASGVFYLAGGPLAGVHFTQLGVWIAIGIAIARRSTWGGERRNMARTIIAVTALSAIGASDMLIVYGVAPGYSPVWPIAWLCATLAALAAVYYELRSDLLRPQGLDRGAALELAGFAIALVAIAALVLAMGAGAPLATAAAASLVWVAVLGAVWSRRAARPVRPRAERALEQFTAGAGDLDHEARLCERLTALWQHVGVEVRAILRVDGEHLVDVVTGAPRELAPHVAAWLVDRGDLVAGADLGTMRLGAIRPEIEALVAPDPRANLASVIVPLIDRGALVGLVEARRGGALREDERGLLVESARAAARALTYAALARAAERERETAHEVEVAEAMRLHASASRGDELGLWTIAAELRTSARTTGASWSANLLADGRLALLVVEAHAHAHGVAAALATAALTGAFAAATSGAPPRDLDALWDDLRVAHSEPTGAFVALLDARAIAWACDRHPGGAIIAPGAAPVSLAARGTADFGTGALLVIESPAIRVAVRQRADRRGRATAPP